MVKGSRPTVRSSFYSRWSPTDIWSSHRISHPPPPRSELLPLSARRRAERSPEGHRKFRLPGCRLCCEGSNGCDHHSKQPDAADSRPNRHSQSCSRWISQDMSLICRTCCYCLPVKEIPARVQAWESRRYLWSRRTWSFSGYKRCRGGSSAGGPHSTQPVVTDSRPSLLSVFYSRCFRQHRPQSRCRGWNGLKGLFSGL